MTDFDFDLFVIGAGSGGVRAARTAAALGARVAIAEERYLGGTCVNVGCVPKKLLSYAAHFSHDFADARAYGWQLPSEPIFDWSRLIDNKNREISRLNGIYKQILETPGVEILECRARLNGPNRVEAGGRELRVRHVLIATGGWPRIPDIPGKEHAISSNEFFFMPHLPASAVVVGGGYIGVELAGIMAGMGADVTFVHRRDTLLPGFDREIAEEMEEALSGYTRPRMQEEISHVDKEADGSLLIHYRSGEQDRAETLLFATGRKPNTGELGLETLDIRCQSNGAILVDENFRTTAPDVYAVGDVIDRKALTPVALAEGEALARQLFGEDPGPMEYANIPSAVFSQPPIATVGLTEAQAQVHYPRARIYKTRFTHMKHSLTGSGEKVFMKMVVDGDSDRVLGLHMMGADAPEIMQGLAVAVKAGATKADFDATLGIHPTAAEEFVTMRTPEETS